MSKRPHSADAQKTVPYPRANDTYTQDQKITAVKRFVQLGSLTEASKATGIPITTISYWKRNSSWWNDTLSVIRREQQDKLDARLTGMIDTVIEEMGERLRTGDEHVLANGEKVMKRVAFKDLSSAGLNNLFNKRQLIRGEPTSQSANITSADQLKALAEEFKKIATEKVIQGSFVVEESTKHIQDEGNDSGEGSYREEEEGEQEEDVI